MAKTRATLSDADLEALEARYTPDTIPACRECGEPLTIQRAGGGEPTRWGHAAPDGVPLSQWAEHYSKSLYVERRPGDTQVLALIAEIRAARTAAQATDP